MIQESRIDEAVALARVRKQLSDALPTAETLRAVRVRSAITQREVANAIGVSRQAVARYEAGDRTPSGEACEQYIDLLQRLGTVVDE
jgi:DNA-binding XRE family transcriptional regulator